MRLNNKISLVTGAGSGFGRGIASRFVEEGAKVVVADINQEAAEMVAEEIGENAIAIVADVSQNTDVSSMIQLTVEQYGRLDILVTNISLIIFKIKIVCLVDHMDFVVQ